MPRYIDHDDRRKDIAAAATKIIAEHGVRGLSLRSVAASLGGSTSIVTHYYRSRAELLADLAALLIAGWRDELADLEQDVADPRRRLWLLLEWLLAINEKGLVEERARINLVAAQNDADQVGPLFDAFDAEMRSLIRDHLDGLVRKQEREMTVDVLRTLTSGICLSAVERPHSWPPKRQRAVLRHTLSALGLGAEQPK
jgi:AcrR family transcriptional regulator